MKSARSKRDLARALVARVVEGGGKSARELRQAAFNNLGLTGPIASLAGKVALHPAQVTDQDISAARAAGSSEEELFELVICAAVGQASRQYEAALGALDEALAKRGKPHAP